MEPNVGGSNPLSHPKEINMNGKSENYLTLAMQKDGRLTKETLSFLWKSGLVFDAYQQKLFTYCRNFPLKILFLRVKDIPDYVSSGNTDLGIIGQNQLYEKRPKVSKLLNLRFGFCSLTVAVLRESKITGLTMLNGKTIATSYPKSADNFFRKKGIDVNLVSLSGSVEIAPATGLSDGIADLVSSGSTLVQNDLKIIEKIYDSEAVLIAGRDLKKTGLKKAVLEKLLVRFKAVLSAKDYKYITLSVPKEKSGRLLKIIPGRKSKLKISNSADEKSYIEAVVREDFIWEQLGRLKILGAKNICIMPLEKIIE